MRRLLICFDVDGTLIDDTVFIWQTIHDRIETDEAERKRWSDAYWNKEITYAQWAEKDIEMWIDAGADRHSIMAAIHDLRPMKGAEETLNILKEKSHILGVISGSLDIALHQAFPKYESLFEHVFLNILRFSDGDQLAGVIPTPFDIEHKATGLVEMCRRTGFDLAETVFIGDNFNDVEVAKIAGCSIAFNCKSDLLVEASDHVVPGPDLRAILPVIKQFSLSQS